MVRDTVITIRLAVCCWLIRKEFEAEGGACSHWSIRTGIGLQQGGGGDA